jgi:hypothetical protein
MPVMTTTAATTPNHTSRFLTRGFLCQIITDCSVAAASNYAIHSSTYLLPADTDKEKNRRH